MYTPSEKQAFAARLRAALAQNGNKPTSASELALQFNLRHPNEPVSSQAVHKWLTGKAVPSPDKVETIAHWLGVSGHWLRFGSALESKEGGLQSGAPTSTNVQISSTEEKLLVGFRLLTTQQKKLLFALINQFSDKTK